MALCGDVEPPSRLKWAESPTLVSPFFDGPRRVDVLDDAVDIGAGQDEQRHGVDRMRVAHPLSGSRDLK